MAVQLTFELELSTKQEERHGNSDHYGKNRPTESPKIHKVQSEHESTLVSTWGKKTVTRIDSNFYITFLSPFLSPSVHVCMCVCMHVLGRF